mgnify:CR=1 FL=1
MLSVGIDPSDNNAELGYTSDSWVTYSRNMSDLFTLDNGLKVNTSKYSGDNVTSNKIYVRYNVETMKYFDTYLFDFDGTLVDSMPTYVSAMLRILDENGITYGDDIVKTITPLGYVYTAKYYRSLGLDMPEDMHIMHLYQGYKKEKN